MIKYLNKTLLNIRFQKEVKLFERKLGYHDKYIERSQKHNAEQNCIETGTDL